MGCALAYVCDNDICLNNEQISEMLDIVNAAASIVTGRRGALKVMPESSEIDALKNILPNKSIAAVFRRPF